MPAEGKFVCKACLNGDGEDEVDKGNAKSAKASMARVRSVHTQIKSRSSGFYKMMSKRLAPFVPKERLAALMEAKGPPVKHEEAAKQGHWEKDSKGKRVWVGTPETKKAPANGGSSRGKGGGKEAVATAPPVPRIGPKETYINAELRSYQVEGVNWILSQYEMGVGGIVADEMGLGKTIQTLSFLAALKEAGFPGPHLIITPLAVLQNWLNEIKKFTPGLSAIKVHGSACERDRILSTPEVLRAEYDIYLTTYEMVIAEESFFTETFLFHTITIDEGHRIKSDSAKLCNSLARISAPFRLLLTGTPLQNNLKELWSLMYYILPAALHDCRETFEQACVLAEGQLDQEVAQQARSLLESLMIRRVKSEVEKTLKPKIQYVLKVPLSALQCKWYRRFMEHDLDASGIVTRQQLIAVQSQLQKMINHPKAILFSLERERKDALSLVKRAEGAEFFKTPECLKEQSEATKLLEAELRALHGRSLVSSSGKLQLLDRLLTRVLAEGSRVLVFTQYTLTLDVLEEYCTARFGPVKQGYLRLDGDTNRIDREMDVRAFNAPKSKIPIYLISTKAGGQGINLATADVVVLYDTCWNPQCDLQAQDRSHRIGQQKQVKVYRLIGQHTMEERILNRARQKLVLDTLVIKKKGETSAFSTEGGSKDDTSDEAAMNQMSIDELWGFLVTGADKLYDPTALQRPSLTDAELDTIIENGRIAGTELEEVESLNDDEKELKKKGIDMLGGSFWHEDQEAVQQDLEVQEWERSVGSNVRSVLREMKIWRNLNL